MADAILMPSGKAAMDWPTRTAALGCNVPLCGWMGNPQPGDIIAVTFEGITPCNEVTVDPNGTWLATYSWHSYFGWAFRTCNPPYTWFTSMYPPVPCGWECDPSVGVNFCLVVFAATAIARIVSLPGSCGNDVTLPKCYLFDGQFGLLPGGVCGGWNEITALCQRPWDFGYGGSVIMQPV